MEDNIKKEIKETRWESAEWIHLALHDRNHWRDLVNTVMENWGL
jgi:hypothetical protein